MEKMCFNDRVIPTEPESATRNLINCQGLEISRRSFGRSVKMTLPLYLY